MPVINEEDEEHSKIRDSTVLENKKSRSKPATANPLLISNESQRGLLLQYSDQKSFKEEHGFEEKSKFRAETGHLGVSIRDGHLYEKIRSRK